MQVHQVHKYRKYPIQYKKAPEQENERKMSLSLTKAAGIMAAVFVSGLISGWVMKKRTH